MIVRCSCGADLGAAPPASTWLMGGVWFEVRHCASCRSSRSYVMAHADGVKGLPLLVDSGGDDMVEADATIENLFDALLDDERAALPPGCLVWARGPHAMILVARVLERGEWHLLSPYDAIP